MWLASWIVPTRRLLATQTMSKPTWVVDDNDEELWGRAVGYLANELSSEAATKAFLKARESSRAVEVGMKRPHQGEALVIEALVAPVIAAPVATTAESERLDQLTKRLKSFEEGQADQDVLLSRHYLKTTEQSSIDLVEKDGNTTFGGIGFFVRPTVAVTTYRNLKRGGYKDTDIILGKFIKGDGTSETAEFTLKGCLVDYDIAVLSSTTYISSSVLLTKANVNDIPVGSKKAAVITLLNGIVTRYSGTLNFGAAILPGSIVRINDYYVLYISETFNGEKSGAALIHTTDGSVIGIHLETVNEAREALSKEKYTVEKVADSLSGLITGISQGFIAVRLDIPELVQLLDN